MPPELAALIGLKVIQAYVSPTRKVFCAIFEGEQFLMAVFDPRPPSPEILFTVAHRSEARGFPPGAFLPELASLRLSGVTGDRIWFGRAGVRITRSGVVLELISRMPGASSAENAAEG
jgi:hypothetical protein